MNRKGFLMTWPVLFGLISLIILIGFVSWFLVTYAEKPISAISDCEASGIAECLPEAECQGIVLTQYDCKEGVCCSTEGVG